MLIFEKIQYFEYFNLVAWGHELFFLTTALVIAGLLSFLESKNFLTVLISIEIIIISINFHLLTSSFL